MRRKELKRGKKGKWNMVRVAKKRDRLQTDLKLGTPERETVRQPRQGCGAEGSSKSARMTGDWRLSSRDSQWKTAAEDSSSRR